MDEGLNRGTFNRTLGLALRHRLRALALYDETIGDNGKPLDPVRELEALVREIGVVRHEVDTHTVMRLAGVRGGRRFP